jgi:hypothetical protein
MTGDSREAPINTTIQIQVIIQTETFIVHILMIIKSIPVILGQGILAPIELVTMLVQRRTTKFLKPTFHLGLININIAQGAQIKLKLESSMICAD